MTRTNKSMHGKVEWREVSGPYGLQIRVSGEGDFEIRGRIRSEAELEATMSKLKAAVRTEYEFQRSRTETGSLMPDSDARQIALFEEAGANWPRIPVLGLNRPAPMAGPADLRSRSVGRARGNGGSLSSANDRRMSA